MPEENSNMIEIKIDNVNYTVPQGLTIIQVCDHLNIEIPRFCYHESLAISGNCRMCLVEVEKVKKPVASCVQQIAPGMSIYTNSPMVKNAREGVMEFLLINHPLDCPICDQGGECDLQDQAFKYGKGYSRYLDEKRAAEDQYMGPLIQTNMTRCIHCTRCVRFIDDIAGTYELGAVDRGEHMAITTYIQKSIKSELSGNIIDLCPVGALTSKPYEFKARSWELQHTTSIDVLDATASNIRIDTRGGEVMRILPIRNDFINEEWISDRTRFSYDGLKYQRLDRPMVRKNGKLVECSWEDAYKVITQHIKSTAATKIASIAGQLTDVETMFLMKKLLDKVGVKNYECRAPHSKMNTKHKSLYVFNTGIAGIEDADGCIIIGSNPRHEAAILNIRLRRNVMKKKMPVWLIGEECDLNYPHKYLGDSAALIDEIVSDKHQEVKNIKNCKKLMLIIGYSVFMRDDAEILMDYFKVLCTKFDVIREDWNGFNVLQAHASQVGGIDVGFTLGDDNVHNISDFLKKAEVILAMNADEIDISKINKNAFLVYIGHHGENMAQIADVILPGAAYTEKNSSYVNLEGRLQHTRNAIFPLNCAKEDWIIIKELANEIGLDFHYSNVDDVRRDIYRTHKEILVWNDIIGDYKARYDIMNKDGIIKDFKDTKKPGVSFISRDPLSLEINDYYLTNVISRHSPTMVKCSVA